jgi:NitT/TauT family transport system permease protein
MNPPIRPEYERPARALHRSAALERTLPLPARIWATGGLRKGLILLVLAVLWELAARWQNNDLLLPTFTADRAALVDGLASGELMRRCASRWPCCCRGMLAGVLRPSH